MIDILPTFMSYSFNSNQIYRKNITTSTIPYLFQTFNTTNPTATALMIDILPTFKSNSFNSNQNYRKI